jgi:hypothetical protein
MSERSGRCPDDHRLVELALGHLTGRDRADVLAHLLGCRSCRERTDRLIDVAEHLLLAAPEAEPPAGFESAVLDRLRLDNPSPRRRRHLRILAGAAALVVAAMVGSLVVPREPSEVVEAQMITPAGREVGAAWRYDSDPSWVFLSVPGWEAWENDTEPSPDYQLRAELDDGSSVVLGEITFRNDRGTWATTTSLDPRRIRSVAVVDETGRIWCEGEF